MALSKFQKQTTEALHCLSLNLQTHYTQRANKTVCGVDADGIRCLGVFVVILLSNVITALN